MNKNSSLAILTYLLIVSILLTACGINSAIPTDIPAIPAASKTANPTDTPTPEATKTPTPVVTETLEPTATETVDPMQARLEKFKGLDCSDWKKPCTEATPADIKDDVLLAYAKSIAQPFGSEASKIKNIWEIDYIDKTFTIEPVDEVSTQYKDSNKIMEDPKKTPVRWVAHFFIKKDEAQHLMQDTFIDIEQIRNADGSSGFLTFYDTADGPIQTRRQILFGSMAYGVPIRPSTTSIFGKDIPKDQWLKQGINMMFDATVYRMDQVNQELDQWVATKTIPTSLEKEILMPEVVSADSGPFVK